MKRVALCGIMGTLFLIGTLYMMLNVRLVAGWSNGGYSSDPSTPDYGTHDWIAQHALDWLPIDEKQYILNNLAAYLYGTELPDNNQAPDRIGDTTKHHVYFDSNGVMVDAAAAVRASEEYDNAFHYLSIGDEANASKHAGIMSHYIVDVAVFGHVMGEGTDWGSEQHHSDYENYVNARTSSYEGEFNSYLSFDGSLTLISAYNGTKNIAYDTTFDDDGDLTCVWMDENYNWSNPTFKDRCGESLNLAVNILADVLHMLYLEAAPADYNPPSTVHDYDGSWRNTDFTVTLTATDDLSGVDETYYKINEGPTKTVSADGQPLITTEGANNTLEYWSIDNAGNEETHHILTEIKSDKTAPSTGVPSREPAGDVQPDQSVKISANVTDAISQVANVKLSYTIDDGATWADLPMNHKPSTNLYEATIPAQSAGTWVKYKIVAYDNAGNNATLDGTEPYCTYQVIPEFPNPIIPLLFIICALVAVMLTKKNNRR